MTQQDGAHGSNQHLSTNSASGSWQQELAVAVAAAEAAGAVIKQAFADDAKQIQTKKNASDLVTATDVQSEQIVLGRIREAFPTHCFIGEEGAAAGANVQLSDEPTWMCDPLDGTTNFVHGYPFVCVSIGLAVRKQLVVGVVYNPVLGEMYTATKGGGAFLNGKPIQASQATELSRTLLATEMGVGRDEATLDKVFGRIRALAQAVRSVRCSGSCALNLCSVACGRIDAFYEIGFGGCWDVAAGALIVTEAGGAVLDPAGGPLDVMARRVLAGSPHITSQIAGILAGVGVSDQEPAAPSQ